jgi:membrane associated rhomboid family serine protease
MSWRDRPYANGGYEQPQMRLQFRKPSTAVMWLLIANVAIHFIHVFWNRMAPGFAVYTFGLSLSGLKSGYFWEPVTYMFLHDPVGLWHILCNMLGLYIFGTEFEKTFGRNRFLQFYGTCAVVGGLAYLVLSVVASTRFADVPLVGASGAIYGLLIAAIIFFPHIRVVVIIFPMPVRVFGLIILAILLLQLLAGNFENPGGEVCHAAGAATGIAIFYAWGIMPQIRIGSGNKPSLLERRRQGSWARKQKKLAVEQAEVDRILAKVHEEGIQSLSRKERRILEQATRRQQERDRNLGRTDQL